MLRRLEVYRIGAEGMIAEEFNGQILGDGFFEGILKSGLQQIGTFFKVIWPGIEGMEYLNHEQVEAFCLGDVPVAVKLDYVCRDDDGGLIISDWKTGAGVYTEHHSDLQMGSYALWSTWPAAGQSLFDSPGMIWKASGSGSYRGLWRSTRILIGSASGPALIRESAIAAGFASYVTARLHIIRSSRQGGLFREQIPGDMLGAISGIGFISRI